MARDLLIMKDNDLFLDKRSFYPSGFISYRLVVCHALKNLFEVEGGTNKSDCMQLLGQLLDSYNNNIPFEKDNFVALYQFETNISNNCSSLVVDKSKGCYPLILYDLPNRDGAFANDIQSIINHFDQLWPLLSSGSDWDKAFERKIDSIFP